VVRVAADDSHRGTAGLLDVPDGAALAADHQTGDRLFDDHHGRHDRGCDRIGLDKKFDAREIDADSTKRA